MVCVVCALVKNTSQGAPIRAIVLYGRQAVCRAQSAYKYRGLDASCGPKLHPGSTPLAYFLKAEAISSANLSKYKFNPGTMTEHKTKLNYTIRKLPGFKEAPGEFSVFREP